MNSDLKKLLDLSDKWSIIPINAHNKKPPIKWEKYQKERATKKQIKAWYKRGFNFAVVTGKISGIIVIDIEKKALKAQYERILDESPTNFITATGGGGRHLFYAYPSSRQTIGNSTGIRDNVDIRADGGYCLLPPSRHISGGRYEWLHSGDRLPLSDKWIKLIKKEKVDKLDNNSEPWLAKLWELGAKEGTRNSDTARLAGYLFGLEMTKSLVMAQISSWNEKNKPPLSQRELKTIIKSVQKTHRRNNPEKKIVTVKNKIIEPGRGLGLVTAHEYLCKYLYQVERWIIDGWLPRETIAMWVANPLSFKTWFMEYMAACIAFGEPFLGRETRQGNVFLFQQEDSHLITSSRLDIIFRSFKTKLKYNNDKLIIQTPPTQNIFMRSNQIFRFDDDEILERFEEDLEDYRPSVIFVDPLLSATSSDNHMTHTASEIQNYIKPLRDKYGFSLVILHHATKAASNAANEFDRRDMIGSNLLSASMETTYHMRRRDDNVVGIVRTFKSGADKGITHIKYDINDRTGFNIYEI